MYKEPNRGIWINLYISCAIPSRILATPAISRPKTLHINALVKVFAIIPQRILL